MDQEQKTIAVLRRVLAYFGRSQQWHSPEAVEVKKLLDDLTKETV